jgi:hypothetical protein
MAGLVPAIHVFVISLQGVDARNKSAHDAFRPYSHTIVPGGFEVTS